MPQTEDDRQYFECGTSVSHTHVQSIPTYHMEKLLKKSKTYHSTAEKYRIVKCVGGSRYYMEDFICAAFFEQQLERILGLYCGERGNPEGVVETLERIVHERALYRAKMETFKFLAAASFLTLFVLLLSRKWCI